MCTHVNQVYNKVRRRKALSIESSLRVNSADLIGIVLLGKARPIYSKQSATTSRRDVLKIRKPKRITQKSREASADLLRSQTCRQYNKTGRHLTLIKCKINSSEATESTLLSMPLTARLVHAF